MGTRNKPYAGGLNGAVASVLRGEKAMVGMSVADLAERSGVPNESTRRYLACERAIDVDTLSKLAGVFNLTATEVMTRAQERLRSHPEDYVKDGGAYKAVRGNKPLGKALDRKPSGAKKATPDSQQVVKKSVNPRRRGA